MVELEQGHDASFHREPSPHESGTIPVTAHRRPLLLIRLSRAGGRFREFPITPIGASHSDELRAFVLPYARVQTSTDLDSLLMGLLQCTDEAAATCANRFRPALERGDHTGRQSAKGHRG